MKRLISSDIFSAAFVVMIFFPVFQASDSSWLRIQEPVSLLSLRILFKLRQRGIHLIPRVRVGCPHIELLVEPARIIQARRSDRDNARVRVGLGQNRRASVPAKAPMGRATPMTGRFVHA